MLFHAIFSNAVLPGDLKTHTRVLILKVGKDPATPLSYRPASLLDTIGKLFKKILLSRILYAVTGRGLIRDEQFVFRPKHSTALQLSRPVLVARVSRNFDEKRQTGAVYLDVAKTFDTVWVDGVFYKLPILNFPSYLVKTISSYLKSPTFEASFQTATSSSRRKRAGIAQGGIISPVLFSLYANDMPSSSPPLLAGSLCKRHRGHSHVSSASAASQIAVAATNRPTFVTGVCYLRLLKVYMDVT